MQNSTVLQLVCYIDNCFSHIQQVVMELGGEYRSSVSEDISVSPYSLNELTTLYCEDLPSSSTLDV